MPGGIRSPYPFDAAETPGLRPGFPMGGAARGGGGQPVGGRGLWQGAAGGAAGRAGVAALLPGGLRTYLAGLLRFGRGLRPQAGGPGRHEPRFGRGSGLCPGHPHFASRALGGLVLLHPLPEQPHPPHQGDYRAAVPAAGGGNPRHGLARFPHGGAPGRLLLGGFGASAGGVPGQVPAGCRPEGGLWPGGFGPGGRRPRGGGPPGAANHLRRGAQGGGVRLAVRPSTRRSASPWTCG